MKEQGSKIKKKMKLLYYNRYIHMYMFKKK